MAKILIIEDEASLLEFYSELLTVEGHVVEKAFDGEVGLELALNFNWDILFLDIMLPKLDGVEVLKKINASGKMADKTVVMLTNLDNESVIAECLRYGAREHLSKANMNPDSIINVVNKYMPKKE